MTIPCGGGYGLAWQKPNNPDGSRCRKGHKDHADFRRQENKHVKLPGVSSLESTLPPRNQTEQQSCYALKSSFKNLLKVQNYSKAKPICSQLLPLSAPPPKAQRPGSPAGCSWHSPRCSCKHPSVATKGATSDSIDGLFLGTRMVSQPGSQDSAKQMSVSSLGC